jgi:thymidylate synthase (FAD)
MVKVMLPSVKILNKDELIDLKPLKKIEIAARTCYKSEDKITNDSCIEFVKNLVKRKHLAMIEFGGQLMVRFICDRGVSHELVRHRLCSFAQESTRWCNYGTKGGEINIIVPLEFAKEYSNHGLNIKDLKYALATENEMFGVEQIDKHELAYYHWLDAITKCEESYLEILKAGISPQFARSVLPNSLKTEINMSANLREWMHIFEQRLDKTAHPEMIYLMTALWNELKSIVHIIFDNCFKQP